MNGNNQLNKILKIVLASNTIKGRKFKERTEVSINSRLFSPKPITFAFLTIFNEANFFFFITAIFFYSRPFKSNENGHWTNGLSILGSLA